MGGVSGVVVYLLGFSLRILGILRKVTPKWFDVEYLTTAAGAAGTRPGGLAARTPVGFLSPLCIRAKQKGRTLTNRSKVL